VGTGTQRSPSGAGESGECHDGASFQQPRSAWAWPRIPSRLRGHAQCNSARAPLSWISRPFSPAATWCKLPMPGFCRRVVLSFVGSPQWAIDTTLLTWPYGIRIGALSHAIASDFPHICGHNHTDGVPGQRPGMRFSAPTVWPRRARRCHSSVRGRRVLWATVPVPGYSAPHRVATPPSYSIGRVEIPVGSRPASTQPTRVATIGMAMTMRDRFVHGM
jgi:hypothetical protein